MSFYKEEIVFEDTNLISLEAARTGKPKDSILNGLVIEAIWGDTLETFMNETLFKRLGMRSTSIGYPTDKPMEHNCWTVDVEGNLHQINPPPKYEASGAEAAALGAYSTVEDLDIFFEFIINTFYDLPHRRISEFGTVELIKLVYMSYPKTESLDFTPIGLFASLNLPSIGALSTNRLQFPNSPFSTYPVSPESEEIPGHVIYMAGSANGCSCATALQLNADRESFAVTVVTNTTSPVDSADHVLRLILQKIAIQQVADTQTLRRESLTNVKEMVYLARAETRRSWKKVLDNMEKDIKKELKVDRVIQGTFEGVGFGQLLEISRKSDKHYITIKGTSGQTVSKEFQIIWINENELKMCVYPHESIDSWGDGDWSNLKFRVEGNQKTVERLVRATDTGEDHFLRHYE